MSQITKTLTSGGPIPPNIPTQFTTDTGIPVIPQANNVNVFGGSGVQTVGTLGTITVNVINDGFPWIDEAVTFNAVAQNGYFCTGVLTVNLPAIATQGNTIIIYVDSASVVTVKANTGQTIQIGMSQSSSSGTATSTAEGSCLTLVYRSSDTEWHSIADNGSWTLA